VPIELLKLADGYCPLTVLKIALQNCEEPVVEFVLNLKRITVQQSNARALRTLGKIHVFQFGEGFIETSQPVKGRSTEAQVHRLQEVAILQAVSGQDGSCTSPNAVGSIVDPAAHQTSTVSFMQFDVLANPEWVLNGAIVVYQDVEVSWCASNTKIAASALLPILCIPKNENLRIRIKPSCRDGWCRSIVNDHDKEIGIGLLKQTSNTACQLLFTIVGRYDDGHTWRRHPLNNLLKEAQRGGDSSGD